MPKAPQPVEQLVLSFGTPIPEANAAAVAATMQAIVILIDAANDEFAPMGKVVLRARPFGRGSLEVPFDIVEIGAPFLIPILGLAPRILDVLKSYFELRKLYARTPVDANSKTETPSQTPSVPGIIVNHGILNILHDSKVNLAVGNAASAIQADETISGFRLLYGEQKIPVVEVARNELALLSHDKSPTAQPKQRQRKVPKAALDVRSPDLLGASMWGFNYKGHTISASVQDAGFLSHVTNGETAFAAGTTVIADLIIDEEFDVEKNAYVAKRYTISKVRDLRRQNQLPGFSQEQPSKKLPRKGANKKAPSKKAANNKSKKRYKKRKR